ncbi:hypothetical protein [Paraburkholderia sp. GAS448]
MVSLRLRQLEKKVGTRLVDRTACPASLRMAHRMRAARS